MPTFRHFFQDVRYFLGLQDVPVQVLGEYSGTFPAVLDLECLCIFTPADRTKMLTNSFENYLKIELQWRPFLHYLFQFFLIKTL